MSDSSNFPTATPIVFTPALLSSLDSSTNSSITRSQSKEQYLQREISNKLNNLINNEKSIISNSIEINQSSENDNMLGSPELNSKLDKIHKILKSSDEAKISKSNELLEIEDNLNNCLLQNKGKPLNCWDLVQKFKSLAGNP